MTNFPHHVYSKSQLPLQKLDLRPPLRLRWSKKGLRLPLIWKDWVVATDSESEDAVCLDQHGRELWRISGPCDGGMAVHSGRLITMRTVNDSYEMLLVSMETGQTETPRPSRFSIDLPLHEGSQFIGRRSSIVGHDRWESALALVRMDPDLSTLWEATVKGFVEELYAFEMAADDDYVYIGRQNYLLALDLSTGSTAWSTSLKTVGGGIGPTKWNPLVSHDTVVITTGNGTAAFDTKTGGMRWHTGMFGGRTIRDNYVYITPSGRYMVLALDTGSVLLDVSLVGSVSSMCNVRHVKLSNYPVVTRTHCFLPLGSGHILALERDTGIPVWSHLPDDETQYVGAVPIISGNRLFMSGSSYDTPPVLHCYEEV